MAAARSQVASVDRLIHRDMKLAKANVLEAVQVILSDRQAAGTADDMVDIEVVVLVMQRVLSAVVDCESDALLLLEVVEQVSAALCLQV